jgi:hypothetical protein
VDGRDGVPRRLVPDLLLFALGSPRGPVLRKRPRQDRVRTARWPMNLDSAITFACLVDLAGEGRLGLDGSGRLSVGEGVLTGSPAHDLLLRQLLAEPEGVTLPTSLWRFRREVAEAALVDLLARGELVPCRAGTLDRRERYELNDRGAVERLRGEVRRVTGGESHDPRANAMLLLCVAAGMRQLLPRGREPDPFHLSDGAAAALGTLAAPSSRTGCAAVASAFRRAMKLGPDTPVAAGLGPGAAALGITTLGDLAACLPRLEVAGSSGG